MNESKLLYRQIANYIVQLNKGQKKSVLCVVKTFAEEQGLEYDGWKDSGFIAEIDKRNIEL